MENYNDYLLHQTHEFGNYIILPTKLILKHDFNSLCKILIDNKTNIKDIITENINDKYLIYNCVRVNSYINIDIMSLSMMLFMPMSKVRDILKFPRRRNGGQFELMLDSQPITINSYEFYKKSIGSIIKDINPDVIVNDINLKINYYKSNHTKGTLNFKSQ